MFYVLVENAVGVFPLVSLRKHAPLPQCKYMTTQQKVEALIEQAAELPDDAQAELVQSLFTMRSHYLGLPDSDDIER